MKASSLPILLLATGCFCLAHGSDVVELTEENFDALVAQGTWMTPAALTCRCSYCRKVRPVWEELATEMKAEGIHIGSIDGSKESVLVSRFDTTGFPSFYHLKDGKCREYDGQRTVKSFAHFARSGYLSVEPMPFYRAPNGPVSRLMANARKLPSLLVELYQWLRHEKDFSQLTILAMTLTLPVSIGLGLICLLDCLHSRTHHRHIPAARPHED